VFGKAVLNVPVNASELFTYVFIVEPEIDRAIYTLVLVVYAILARLAQLPAAILYSTTAILLVFESISSIVPGYGGLNLRGVFPLVFNLKFKCIVTPVVAGVSARF
jgi:hypothetical protein